MRDAVAAFPFADESEGRLVALLTDTEPVVAASALYALGHLGRGERGLMDAIVLTLHERGEALQNELRGNLAAIVQTKRSSESDDLSLQESLVAGARNPLNLEFSWTAA